MNTRNTLQRTIVLETVLALQCHATADEVFDVIAKKYPSISRGTVYRNLNLLAEMGEVRKIGIPNGADRFDHRLDGHYHAKCRQCGRVFDVDMAYMEHLQDRIQDAHGFHFMHHDIIFTGICYDCRHDPKGETPFTTQRGEKK